MTEPDDVVVETTIDLEKLRQVWFHERGEFVYSGFVLWENADTIAVLRSGMPGVLNRSASVQSYQKPYNKFFDTELEAKQDLVCLHNRTMGNCMNYINGLLTPKKAG